MHNSFFSDACPFSHVPEHNTFIIMEACLHWSMKLITVVHLLSRLRRCSSIPPLRYTLSCLVASLCTTQNLILHFWTSYLVLLFNFFHLIYFIGHRSGHLALIIRVAERGFGSQRKLLPPPPGRVDRLKILTLNQID